MKKVSLSFRVDTGLRAQLDNRAKALGVKESNLVREILSQYFDKETEIARLRSELKGLRHEFFGLSKSISKTREDLALGVEALLVSGNKKVEPERASAWVDENMRDC